MTLLLHLDLVYFLDCLFNPHILTEVTLSHFHLFINYEMRIFQKAGEIIRSYSNGNGGGRSANSATVAVKSASLSCTHHDICVVVCCTILLISISVVGGGKVMLI